MFLQGRITCPIARVEKKIKHGNLESILNCISQSGVLIIENFQLRHIFIFMKVIVGAKNHMVRLSSCIDGVYHSIVKEYSVNVLCWIFCPVPVVSVTSSECSFTKSLWLHMLKMHMLKMQIKYFVFILNCGHECVSMIFMSSSLKDVYLIIIYELNIVCK